MLFLTTYGASGCYMRGGSRKGRYMAQQNGIIYARIITVLVLCTV